MDYRELVNLGLSEKEAKVYLAALELGESAVQKIAQKAGVNRATTYVQIENLMDNGLMSSVNKDKKQYFVAESPEKLNLIFSQQKLEIEERKKQFRKILPQLKKINIKNEERPVVRFFSGKEGLKSIADELSTIENEPVRMLYSQDLLLKLFSEKERMKLREERIKKNIKSKVLYNYSKGNKKSTPDGLRKKVDDKKFPFFCDITIYGKNKVRIATLKGDILGIVIENEEIYKTFKNLFDLAWFGVKTLEK